MDFSKSNVRDKLRHTPSLLANKVLRNDHPYKAPALLYVRHPVEHISVRFSGYKEVLYIQAGRNKFGLCIVNGGVTLAGAVFRDHFCWYYVL